MNVFEIISTNLDINDESFLALLFADIEEAKRKALEEVESHGAKGVVHDFEGILTEFEGKTLKNKVSYGKPAVYYRSHFGDYRCVVFVKTREVY